MSSNSTPGHSSSVSFDGEYSDNFSAEITAKMHVPDKIIINGAERQEINQLHHSDDIKSNMNVPDRILLAGDNKHITLRDTLPEMKFDIPFSYQYPNCVLEAPPDVLTVDEYPYPTVDLKPKTEVKKKVVLDQTLNSMNDLNESSMSAGYTPDEEVAILRRQVRHLARRVLSIEQENQQRQQREIIMYGLGVTYFLIKSLLWLHRHF